MPVKYKHLVVSGCSFTSNEPATYKEPWAWPNHLGYNNDIQVHNLAIGGAGNDHISRSLIVYLEQNNFNPAETLVAAMWSGIGRIDFVTGITLPTSGIKYHYTDNTNLIAGGNWWNTVTPSGEQDVLLRYSRFQTDASFALTSWLAMTSLENYLKANGYEYFFTSFVNYKNGIRGDAVNVDYESALASVNLQLDRSKWLPFADSEYLGDWCRENDQLGYDNWHPGVDAPRHWVKQVLEPMLIKQQFLNK